MTHAFNAIWNLINFEHKVEETTNAMLENGISIFTLMKNESKESDNDEFDEDLLARLKQVFERFTKVLEGYNHKVEKYKKEYLAVLKTLKLDESEFTIPW